MEIEVPGMESLSLRMTGMEGVLGLLGHLFLLCFASIYPEQSRECWREEGSTHTEKKEKYKV